VDVELLRQLSQRPIALDGGKRHLRLKAGVWFRRGRLFMVSPDSQATACPPSGRNSTYRPVQFSEASSRRVSSARVDGGIPRTKQVSPQRPGSNSKLRCHRSPTVYGPG
jgi:hypothetical protein